MHGASGAGDAGPGRDRGAGGCARRERAQRSAPRGAGSAADAVGSVDVREALGHRLIGGQAVFEDGVGGVHIGPGRLGAGHPLPSGDRC